MSDESTALNLLAGLEFKDSRLYSLLDMMIRDFYALDRQINPPTTTAFGISGVQVATVDGVSGFSATLYTNNLRLDWIEIESAIKYEVKYLSGSRSASDWDIANSILTTSTTSADLNPITIPLLYGNHTFFIKATDGSGIESTTASIVVVNIPQITAPVITTSVIDNFVLLKWTIPTSVLEISHYNVRKDGVSLGEMDGTFEAIFETTSGTYTYTVEAEDIAGNVGTSTSVTLAVRQPPDFELSDTRVSDFSGTKVNTVLDGGYLLANVNTAETFEDHFINNSWDHPQDQIDAGYPIHSQPSQTTGSYEEIVDYGTLITNTILTLVYSTNELSPTVTVQPRIATSTDGISYTAFSNVASLFASSLRYAKIRFEFTGSDDDALTQFTLLQMRLDVKREVDSGAVAALAADTDGTEVFFNKTFLDIDSITLTVAAIQPVTAIYSFVDIPNPVSFKVLCYDSSGNRVDYVVSWKARGIV